MHCIPKTENQLYSLQAAFDIGIMTKQEGKNNWRDTVLTVRLTFRIGQDQL